MKNRLILNWRSWSIVRKAQVVGASVGLVATLVFLLVFAVTSPHEPFGFSWVLWFVFCDLPLAIMRWTGITLGLIAVINSLLCLTAGSVIGELLKVRKSRRN
ncbi:MAG TPA: hypothetical protein PKA41_18110 [Verrucomicrobiota bacterium]|nr:hypothetical protein [Verrucomicrobiota bacterium]